MANSSLPTAAQQLQNSAVGQQTPSAPLDLPVRPQVPVTMPGLNLSKPLGLDLSKPLSSEDQVSAPAAETSNLAATKSAIRPNALSDLASYTYNIDLYLTNIAGHQRYASEEKFYPQDWYRVISSVGGLSGARPGTATDSTISSDVQSSSDAASQYFTREYYIDNLEIETTNGLTPSDSNISFTLIEPYGINFIQELWNFSTHVLKVPNYTELCVLLVISWKGFTETGEFVELDYHKYVPVKIATLDVKVTSTGAQYSVTAVGYNDLSKDKVYGIANSGFELEGATLRDLIGDDSMTTASNLTTILNNQPTTILNNQPTDSQVKPSNDVSTIYKFQFDDLYNTGIDIGKFVMANSDDIPSKDFPMSTPDASTQADVKMLQQMKKYQLLDSVRKPDDIQINKTKVNFNKGGQILEILTRLICNSTYITDQLQSYRKDVILAAALLDETERKNAFQKLNKPLNWFRIMTKVYPTGKFDKKNNNLQQTIIYSVVPVRVYDTRGAGGGGGDGESIAPVSPPPADLVVKEFNYLFTGKNTEILNVDINLNLSFFTYTPSNTNTADQGSGAFPADDSAEEAAEDTQSNPNTTKKTVNTVYSALIKQHDIPHGSGAGSGVGNATTDRLYARAVSDALFASQDMITLDLDILGDPDFIKQDGIFYQKTTESTSANNLGFPTESTERFIRFTFKSPADINTETGFPDDLTDTGSANTPMSSTKTVMFDGLYCVLGVVSHFKDGKFTQTIKMRRSITETASQIDVNTDDSSPAKPPIPNAASHS